MYILFEYEEESKSECTSCPLYSGCKTPNIKPVGPLNADILLVGEAPGKEEDAAGTPFIGPAGKELDSGLEYAGLYRDEILITNTCRCFPKGKPKPSEITKCCKKHLYPLIKRVNPKVIIAAGGVALYALTGLDGIMKRQNTPIYSDRFNCHILPVIHPARVLYTHDSAGKERLLFRQGLSYVKKILSGKTNFYDYGDYTVIDSPKQAFKALSYVEAMGTMCYDIETDGFDGKDPSVNVTTFGFGCKERESFAIPFSEGIADSEHFPKIVRKIGDILENPKVGKIGQNMKFDAQFLFHKYGFDTRNWFSDTMIAHFLTDETKRSHSLSEMTWRYLPSLAGYDDVVKSIGGAHLVEVGDILYTYCMADVDATFRLHNIFRAILEEEGQWWFFSNVLMPAAKVLSDMEIRGVTFDRSYMNGLDKDMTKKKFIIEAKMRNDPGVKHVENLFDKKFNPRSSPMLQALLLDYYKLPVLSTTKKGNPALNKDSIKKYAVEYGNKYCSLLNDYRKLDKHHGTYIKGILEILDKEDKAYPKYHLVVTHTGRTSSSNPNIQNIPREKVYKNMIISQPGYYLMREDFSQSEIRVGAMVSDDENLIAVCNDITKDFHKAMASMAFSTPYDEVTKDQRQDAKGVSFGVFYLMGAPALAEVINKPVKTAQKFIDDYFKAYPGLRRWIDETIYLIRTKNWVSSPFGRRRRFPKYNLYENDWQRAECERQGVNAIIQATSSDLMLITMTRIENRLISMGLKSRVLLEIHDDVTVLAHESETDYVYDIMSEEIRNCTKGFEWAEKVIMRGDIEIGTKRGELTKYNVWKEEKKL